MSFQPGILAPLPAHARYLTLSLRGDAEAALIVNALFGFSTPETGATFWCPPSLDGRLDLRALHG